MKEETLQLESVMCPECGEPLTLTHLGEERPRHVCGRFGCDFDGVTL